MRTMYRFALALIALISLYALLMSDCEQNDKRFIEIVDNPKYQNEGKDKRSTQEVKNEEIQERFKRGAVNVTNFN